MDIDTLRVQLMDLLPSILDNTKAVGAYIRLAVFKLEPAFLWKLATTLVVAFPLGNWFLNFQRARSVSFPKKTFITHSRAEYCLESFSYPWVAIFCRAPVRQTPSGSLFPKIGGQRVFLSYLPTCT